MTNDFIKAAGCVILAIIFCTVLSKHEKHIALCLSLAVCCIVMFFVIRYFTPVISFINKLQTVSNIDSTLLSTVIKAVGIGLISEIVSNLCADSGNAALGKALQILAISVIVCMCIPLLNELLELIESILGRI